MVITDTYPQRVKSSAIAIDIEEKGIPLGCKTPAVASTVVIADNFVRTPLVKVFAANVFAVAYFG